MKTIRLMACVLLVPSLALCADAVRIVNFMPYMRAGRIAMIMQVTNTQSKAASVALAAQLGERMTCATNLTVAARRSKNAILAFGDLPEDFIEDMIMKLINSLLSN